VNSLQVLTNGHFALAPLPKHVDVANIFGIDLHHDVCIVRIPALVDPGAGVSHRLFLACASTLRCRRSHGSEKHYHHRYERLSFLEHPTV